MTKEGDRGRGPSGGPSVPSARAGASQRKEVNKSGRRLCIVFVGLGTIRNHRQPPDPTQAFQRPSGGSVTAPNQGKFLGAVIQIQRAISQPQILAKVWTDKKGQGFPSGGGIKVGVHLKPLKENTRLLWLDGRGGTRL